MNDPVVDALLEARAAEKEQALHYRALSAEAEVAADAGLAERFNELLADEQHHFARISARLTELGIDAPRVTPPPASIELLERWEEIARGREEAEVARYEELLKLPLDSQTSSLIEEILATERQHARSLAGKWTEA